MTNFKQQAVDLVSFLHAKWYIGDDAAQACFLELHREPRMPDGFQDYALQLPLAGGSVEYQWVLHLRLDRRYRIDYIALQLLDTVKKEVCLTMLTLDVERSGAHRFLVVKTNTTNFRRTGITTAPLAQGLHSMYHDKELRDILNVYEEDVWNWGQALIEFFSALSAARNTTFHRIID